MLNRKRRKFELDAIAWTPKIHKRSFGNIRLRTSNCDVPEPSTVHPPESATIANIYKGCKGSLESSNSEKTEFKPTTPKPPQPKPPTIRNLLYSRRKPFTSQFHNLISHHHSLSSRPWSLWWSLWWFWSWWAMTYQPIAYGPWPPMAHGPWLDMAFLGTRHPAGRAVRATLP